MVRLFEQSKLLEGACMAFKAEDVLCRSKQFGTLFMGQPGSGDESAENDTDEAGGGGRAQAKTARESAKPKTLTRKEVIEILQTTRDFSGLDLRKANLTKLDFSGCRFAGSNCSYVNFKDSNLDSCDFSDSSLWNANLEGANLTRSNLEDADLDYTKLRGAVLFKANIRRATLPTDLIPREEILRSVNEGSKISR